jgi:hypothetical protein
LTIKFTRHTAASPVALSSKLSALRKTTPRRANSTSPACSSHESGHRCQVTGLRKTRDPIEDHYNRYVHQQALGTHKIHFAL